MAEGHLIAVVLGEAEEVIEVPDGKTLLDVLDCERREEAGVEVFNGIVLFFNKAFYRADDIDVNAWFERNVRRAAPFAPQFRGVMVCITRDGAFATERFVEACVEKWGTKPDREEVPEELVHFFFDHIKKKEST